MKARYYLPLLVPVLAHGFRAWQLGPWNVDDAGISFAYARSLSEGHGLVSQPGVLPVEGYSNLLWILLLTPLFRLHLFDPRITPAVVSVVLVLVFFVLVHRRLSEYRYGVWVSMVGLTLVALNTPFLLWVNSGLETPLYVLTLWLLFSTCLRRQSVAAGLLAAGAAMVRPEGVLYFVAFPLVAVRRIRPLVSYAVTLALSYGSFLVFRLLYFGELYPNTYYAKGGPSGADVLAILTLRPRIVAKVVELGRAFADAAGLYVMAAGILLTFGLLAARRLKRTEGTLAVFALVAGLAYLLMPADWLQEYRFAVPFVVFGSLYLVVVGGVFLQTLELGTRRRALVAAMMATGVLAGSGLLFRARSEACVDRPSFPLERVRGVAEKFDSYADRLGIEGGSYLGADVGGMLYYSHLRVYDLGGLCDATIARTRPCDIGALTEGGAQQRWDARPLCEYIFGVVKPTFIRLSGKGRLGSDARFEREYLSLDGEANTAQHTGRAKFGAYVRRDAVREKAVVLGEIQRERELERELR